MTRAFVVDDHPLMRSSVAAAVAEVLGPDALVETFLHPSKVRWEPGEAPDLIVSDLMFGDRPDGFDLAERMERMADPPPVVFLSSYEQPALVARALDLGAAGYLSKAATKTEIAEAVHAVMAGGVSYARRLLDPARKVRGRLSAADRALLAGIAGGKTNKEVAGDLGCAEKTVEARLSRLFARMGAVSRAELVAIAVRDGELLADPRA